MPYIFWKPASGRDAGNPTNCEAKGQKVNFDLSCLFQRKQDTKNLQSAKKDA